MLTISAELLHGTLRATGFDDISITGDGASRDGSGLRGEWPPSPARVFSALVAADGTGPRRHVTGGAELRILEQAPAPRILASPLEAVLRSRLRDRFVVVDRAYIDNTARSTASVQEYVGRTATALHTGTRMAPACRTVSYAWDDLVVDDAALRALALRAARVGYLGCADSPVRLSVGTLAPPEDHDWWVPSDDGTVVLPVPYEGFLRSLDASFGAFVDGTAVRRAWVPNRYVRYRPPGTASDETARPVVLWVRFERPVSGRRLRDVTEALRLAVLERYTKDIAGSPERVPNVLSGHGYEGSGYQHAQFLALPDVGHPHARGTLHGGAVMLPSGTPPEVVEGVRSCLWRTQVLARSGTFETRVRPYAGEVRPLAAAPGRWEGPARRWVSATPVVHERFQRQGLTVEEVARWCEHSGVAARPLGFRISEVPLGDGALSLSPTEVYRVGKRRPPYSHLAVSFDRVVTGPVVLGGARQFGFGLMYPVSSRGRNSA